MKNLIVLLIDGLNPRFLSPYGCTWVDTPSFDRLAAESLVLQQAVSESNDAAKVIAGLLQQAHPASLAAATRKQEAIAVELRKRLPDEHAHTQFIWYSDDPDHGTVEGFDKVVALNQTKQNGNDAQKSAGMLSETHLATSIAKLSTELPLLTSPFIAFVHLSSMVGCWDAPLAMREKYRDEDDPEASTVTFPQPASGDFDPDEILAWSHAYAAQIETLDSCLGVLLDELTEDGLLENSIFVTCGLRSFPIGHSQFFGMHPDCVSGDAVQVPSFIRLPNAERQHLSSLRNHRVISTRQMISNLVRWTSLSQQEIESEVGEALTNRQVNQPIIIDGGEVHGIWTPAWLAIVNGEEVRLFVKPDDRWDVNPVQDRCRWIAQELADTVRDAIREIRQGNSVDLSSLADELMLGLG